MAKTALSFYNLVPLCGIFLFSGLSADRHGFTFCGLSLQAQTTSQTSFGKNRVQYHHQFDDWSLYETPNFTTYWYGDARNVAHSALQMAEFDFPAVQQLLEHQLTDKIEILVFSDLTDLKQSNIGEDDVFLLSSGETKVVGNKVFIFFDGDHRHLRAQIREGIAGVLINSMLYGANLQEIVSNAVLLNLPTWYTSGLTAYCGEEWTPKDDDRLRDLLQTGRYKTFDKLAREHPRFAGNAFWHYISTHFGPGTVSNLLYLTRINRSVDNGFFYILGSGYRRTTEAMLEHYKKIYREEARGQKTPNEAGKVVVKNRKKLPLSPLKISPDGKKIAWASNDIGKWKVYVQDLETGKRRRVLKGGARNALQATDYNYPKLAWNPDNQRLAILYERRDVVRLANIDLTTHKKELSDLSPEFQRVFSMDYITPSEIALSAAVKGQSDLFVYRTITRQTERLTNDFWDDLDVSVATVDGHKSLLFASNRSTDTLSFQRLDTILPIASFDIFLFDLENRSPELIRITETPLFDERNPIGLDSAHFAYLSDESGVINRQVGMLEPFVAYHQAVIYLKDGSEVKALDMSQPTAWPLARILTLLAPLDTVLKNIDSTQIDSIKSAPIFKKKPRVWNSTNYDRNIQEQHSSPCTGRIVEGIKRGKKVFFYQNTIDPKITVLAKTTRWREQTLRAAGLSLPPQPPLEAVPQTPDKQSDKSDDLPLPLSSPDSLPYIEPGWLIQIPDYLAVPGQRIEPDPSRAPETKTEDKIEPPNEINTDSMVLTPPRRPLKKPSTQFGKNGEIVRFYSFKIIPYRLRFRTDYVSTTMDNNQLFEGLQLYEGPQSRLLQPPPGVLLRANFKDLLENYVIEAGFRLPTTFNGAEYYLWMDDKKKRLDKRYVLYRRTLVTSRLRGSSGAPNLPPDFQERTTTLMGQYELRYPLDVFTSLRATFGLREDKVRALSSDIITLALPDRAEQRASVRLAAVFDNSVDVDLNLKTGTRAKVYTDLVKGFAFNTEPNWSLKLNNGFMTVVGFDARHYQMLDRRSQLALRFAGATSFGSEKMLYILGGVDNWVFPKFNENITLPADDGFAYQAPAVNLRGFKQNIRNGNTFALMNAELRVPVFKYFFKKPVIGNFWRNFQIVGFFDAGTAWQGKSPYSFDNPINTQFLIRPTQGPIISTMKVNYFRDPIVMGYGVGLRSVIFGLYLRADYAWGIESRQIQKPMLHIALGTDF
ncbi:MAG: BamA/TamA family outer membrane protein [Phycisphaerae bacterium]|nr:BamA/TamA family outer membrane protein [Saprospiraceae bacterium]